MKKIDANPQGFLSELGKLLAEEKEKKAKENLDEKTKLEQKFGIETVAPTTLGEFFSQIAHVKEEIVESQKEEKNKFLKKYKIESIVPEELFGRLLQAKEDLEQELKEEIEKVEAQPIVETVVEEPTTVIAEVSEEQPKPKTIVDQVVAKITQQQENTNLFTDPQPEKTSPTIKALQDKLKSLEQWMGKISMAGPGSGSYWLNDLGDTDKTSLKNATEGQVLTFNEETKKWYAADATGGGGGPTLDTYARVTANAAFNQANTSLSTGFYANLAWSHANAAFDYANTISGGSGVDTWARDKANTASVTAQSGFDKANSANVLAQAAFNQANTVPSALANSTYTIYLNDQGGLVYPSDNTVQYTAFDQTVAFGPAQYVFDVFPPGFSINTLDEDPEIPPIHNGGLKVDGDGIQLRSANSVSLDAGSTRAVFALSPGSSQVGISFTFISENGYESGSVTSLTDGTYITCPNSAPFTWYIEPGCIITFPDTTTRTITSVVPSAEFLYLNWDTPLTIDPAYPVFVELQIMRLK